MVPLSRAGSARRSRSSTRDRLLEAARALFADGGYEATSTRSIAAKARCNLSLIRYYFGSKEGLLREVLASNVVLVRRELESTLVEGTPLEDRVRTFIRFVVGFAARNHDLLRVAFRELLLRDSPLVSDLQGFARGNISVIRALVEAGQVAGVVREGVDARFAGPAMIGMILFYFLAYPITEAVVGPKSPELLDELADQITGIYLRGILVDRAEPEGGAS